MPRCIYILHGFNSSTEHGRIATTSTVVHSPLAIWARYCPSNAANIFNPNLVLSVASGLFTGHWWKNPQFSCVLPLLAVTDSMKHFTVHCTVHARKIPMPAEFVWIVISHFHCSQCVATRDIQYLPFPTCAGFLFEINNVNILRRLNLKFYNASHTNVQSASFIHFLTENFLRIRGKMSCYAFRLEMPLLIEVH